MSSAPVTVTRSTSKTGAAEQQPHGQPDERGDGEQQEHALGPLPPLMGDDCSPPGSEARVLVGRHPSFGSNPFE